MPVRYGSDKTGPLKDVPYDGVLTKADGKVSGGTHGPAGSEWPPARQKRPVPWFVEKLHAAVQDVIDQYNPDLLYFDDNSDWDFDRGGGGVWLGHAGTHTAYHGVLYNATSAETRVSLDAVFNIKNVPRRC